MASSTDDGHMPSSRRWQHRLLATHPLAHSMMVPERMSAFGFWLQHKRRLGNGRRTGTIDRISSAVHRGVSRDGRFVGGGARDQEPDGDTRRIDNDLDRFGPSDRRNTLRPVSLVYCIDLDDQVA